MKVFSSKFKQILAIIMIVCLTFANNSFSLFASQTEFPTMESKDVSDYTDEAESEDSKLNNENIESDENESRENLDASKPAGSHSGDIKNNTSKDNNKGETEDDSRKDESKDNTNRDETSDDSRNSESNEGSRKGEFNEPEKRKASPSIIDDTLTENDEELEDSYNLDGKNKASMSEADEDEASQNSSDEDDELVKASASEIDEENLNLKNKNIASLSETKKLSSPSEIEEETKIASESEIEIEIASESELKLNNKLFGADHTHKICGATAGGSCLHTLGATHDATFDYTYEAFFNGATLTEDDIKNKLENSRTYYYLDQDISFSALTQLTINNVLVLCLNGKNINNVYFSGADIIITNCTNTTSKITNPSDSDRLFNGNTFVYGMHNNINLNTDSLVEAVANGAALFFDVAITSPDNTRNLSRSAVGPDNGLNIVFESVDVKGLSRMYSFFNLNGKDNVTVAIKNCKFEDLKNNISTILFMNDSHQGSSLNFYGDNLFSNIEVGFNEYEAIDRIEAIITVRRSDMFVQDGTTTIESCISRGRSILLESVHDTANIEIKEGANLVLNNNQIHMQSVTTCAMYINNRFRLYGNLTITNNKVINCGTINTVEISGLYYLYTGAAIPVGNSKIIVSGNTSDGDEKTYPRQHLFQVLAHRTAGLFSQEAGTELDINSRMTVAFTSGAAGTIMSDWSHSDDKAFDTIFKADKFTDDEFLIVKDQNKAVRVMSHGHKICGYSSLEECDHRGIASHSEIFSYSKFFGNSTMTDADIEAKLNAGGSYRLDKDINLTSLTQIRLTADLYLCLNGKSMHNVTFGSGTNNNFKIYITNCKNEDSIVTRSGDSAEFIINYSNVSVMAPYKNITLNQATRFLYNVTTTAAKFDLYGLNFTCSAAWPLTNSLIRSDSAGSEVNVSNVNISNFDASGNFGHIQMVGTNTNKSSLNIYESKFEGNTHTGNYDNSKSLIYADHCDTNIYDTDIINNKVGMAFYNGGSGTSNFKNVNMTGNETHCWVVNLNGTTNTFDNVNVSNNTWGVKYGGAVVDVKGNAVLNVKASGLKINNNTEVLETPTVLYVTTGGVLNVEEGATLEINENKLKYYTSPMHDIFSIMPGAIDYGYTLNILGNLYVENNKIVNATTPATKQFAAVYISYEKKMNVGNGVISIQNNFIYSDADGNVRADDTASEYYHMYQMYTNNANGLFTQEPGTEMSTDSKIELGFYSSPYMGMFFNNWAHSDKDAFKTIFSADKYRDDEFSVVKDENNKLRIMAHGHKICGHADDEECDHRGIATHSEVFSYAAFFGSTTMTDTQKVNKLRAGGSYRLDEDLVLSGPTNVNLNADLYLCLNGKTLNNVVFDSSGINNHKVYITNCKKETATIRRETGAAWFITNYKDASVMAPHKNINLVNSNRMKNDTGTANKLDLYGVTFSQDPKGEILLALISTVAGGSEINLSNVNISNYDINDVNYALIDVAGSAANKATLNIYESSFENNNDKRNNHYRNNIIYASHCNTGIYDTVFKNNSCSTVFTNINSGFSKFQNVEFVNNETLADVINLTGTTNDFDNVNVSNNKRAVTQNTAVIDVTNNAVLNVKAGGLKVNKNTQVIGAVDCIWLGDDGVLNVEEGATLEIKENIFTHTSISTAMPAYSMILGNEGASRTWEINIFGNLYVENNKLVNAPNPMNVVFAGLYIKDGKRITTGNGVVKVQNNGVYTDADGKVKADEKVLADYHPYQVLADNINGFLAQAAGTEISIDSRMEVAFINSPYIGIIYDSWTHSNKNAYETIFTADRFRDEDLKVVKDENNKIRIMTHGHKICGFDSGVECNHRGIATHSEVYSYFAFFGNATIDDAQIVTKLTAGGTYKLDKDLELAAATEINLTADLFICLNGHSLKNVYFNSPASNAHKIYITNCKNTKVKISRSDNSANFINNYSAVSVIAPYKNIDMENSTRFLYALNTTTSKFDLYGLNLSLDGINSIISVSLIRSNSPGSEINISSVKISNYEANDNFAILQGVGNNTNRVKINIYDSIFNNNKNQTTGAERSTIFTSHCDVNIQDTDFTNNSTATIFYNQDSGTTFFKNVNIVNNNVLEQVLNLNSSTNTFENVNMTNNSWGNGLPCALIDVKLSAVLNVKGLGMKANDNTQKSTNYLCFYMNSGTLNVEEGSKLEINNNKCMAVQSAGDYPYSILPGANGDNTLNILGDLSIQNNKFVNVSTSINQKYVGLYLKDGNVLNVGNGVITVKNNLTYTDADGRAKADEKISPLFHPYQVMLGGTTNSFTQAAGTELSVDSRMEIAFRNSPYTGVFFKDWKHSDILKYDTIFSADKFNNNNLTVNLNLDGHLEIVDGGHLHKPCGIDKTAVCSHRGIDDHDYGIPFTAFSNGIDMTNNTAIRNKLAAGGYYFADQDITASAIQAVTLTADLYLCLNGKNMTNIRFSDSNYKVFITNCSNSEITIRQEATELFKALSVHMLAGKGRINVVSNGFYYVRENGSRTINSTFYNILSTSHNGSSSDMQLFHVSDTSARNSSYIVSNCEFRDHQKNVAPTSELARPVMLFKRVKGRIYDCKFANNTTINSSFLIYEGSDVEFSNCIFDNISTGGPSSGSGSLFRLDSVYNEISITFALENITILNSEMHRSFVEVNDDARGTVTINDSFVANNNFINKSGGNNFFNTKTLKLTNAKLELTNNTSNNNGLPGLVSAQNSIELRNSYINISDNTIKRNASGQQSLLKLDTGDILVASNSYIVIKNNKINTDGITGNNSILSALYLQAGQTIAIEDGTSYIDISGNEPIGNQKDHVNNHMYQIYMNKTSSTTEELFKTRNNGYIDVSKSYAEFALPTGTPTGNLFDTWNATNVKNWHADVHKNHFTASTFGSERKNLVVAHYKHTLILTEKEKYIDSQKAYIDSAGDPCVATVPEALRHDADGNKFIWWFPTEIRDAYGNIINDAKNFTLNEQYRPIMELSKWTAAADDKTRTAWDFKPIYATTYTVYLDSRYTARTEETNSYYYQFTARRGDPVTLKDFFPRLDDSRFKFLNYNTDYNGNGKTFTLGLYSRGLLASDNPSINLYGFYSFGGGGGGRTGGGGSSGGGGELQKTGSGSYQYVTAIYETHSHIADLTPLTVAWQKWDHTYVAYAIFQYDDRGYPISYAQLKDGFYLIRWNGVDHVYGFDKAGNMLTGYVECGGHKYIMAPDGEFEGSMLKSNAFVFGGAYMIAEDGIVNENNVYVANQFVYDMDIGRYKYIDYIADSKTPVFISNELRNITHRSLTAKYLFNRDGYMVTGLTGYQNKIYYFNEFGPYIGSAYVGTVYAGGGHATFNSQGELVYNGTKEDMARSGIPVQSASLTQGW